ncbi:hypothetical protein CC78DRAFT_596243 [Lojkania enalia]|uniref:PWWP domain-containing protein n=1 Tax=Lojkania enalia TaxID=147567 RepID=A0A9P4NCB7_9PLEO|nr:hypothetical protein CC78DRAFT_596243 [Didymosphaeria enalia]
MADQVNAAVAVDIMKPVEEITRAAELSTESAVAEAKPGNDDAAPTGEAGEGKVPSAKAQKIATDETITTDPKTDDTTAEDESAPAEAAINGTPASAKKAANGRRKSGPAVPEHKKKTPNKKKKAAPELHLDVMPGQLWFVAMKGYPPWPVIICDEGMLPETLLSKRPVSAKRIDGTYRPDFEAGGKNAKDRRYPIMFLGTNEFAWQVNTDLQPLVVEDIKKDVSSGNQGKKSKALWDAYQIAAEDHDINWFKEMLNDHEKAVQADVEEKAAAEAKKQEKKEKAARRKSAAAAEESEDDEMEGAGDEDVSSTKKAKLSKKRKKDAESDGEQEKPAKTPKVRLTNKAKDVSVSKSKKEPKPKKAKAKSDSEEVEVSKPEEKPLTEAERLEKREKSVLYLRHRLQKGFLSRDQAPKEEEMESMNVYLKQLEEHPDLEAKVIKQTKVHKVLKAILKLDSIPKEDEYHFKKRSGDLLNTWNRALAADVEALGDASAEPATNGVKHENKSGTAETAAAKSGETTKEADGDGDVLMADAKDETSATKADAATNAEGAAAETTVA